MLAGIQETGSKVWSGNDDEDCYGADKAGQGEEDRDVRVFIGN